MLNIDAGMLLQQVDAGAGTLDLATDGGGNAQPFVPGLAEIFHGAVDGAVLLDQWFHDVVHGLKQFCLGMRPPCRHRKDIVTGFRLAFGGNGQLNLVALAGDVIDRNLDLLLFGPLIDQIGTGLVGAGDPVVPEADGEFAGGVSAANIGRRDQRGG